MRQNITRNGLLLVSMLFVTLMTFGQNVTTGADSGPGSLRDAIATANGNLGPDVITFDDNITVMLTSGEIAVTEDLTITGGVNTVIDGSGNSGRMLNFTAGIADVGSSITDVTFLNGTSAVTDNGGGAVLVDGSMAVAYTLTVDACTFTGNDGSANNGSGGAILHIAGALTVTNSTFTDNTAARAGGAIEIGSDSDLVTITNTSFTGNDALGMPGNGGAMHITGAPNSNITGGTATMNTAALEGGAFWNGSGNMLIDGVTITNNEANGAGADDGGGGLFNNGGSLVVQGQSIITGNSASGASGSGGGILSVSDGIVSIDDSTISGNGSNRAGGGIEMNGAGMLTMIATTLDGNITGPSPGNGGGLHITGSTTVNITGGTASGNTADNEGGGLWNGSGVMTIAGTTIDSNLANGDDSGASGGGGIFNEGGTVSTDATTMITNNNALVGSGSGGGVLVAGGTFTATGTTITGNVSNRAGGGIEVRNALSDDSPATINLTNVTLDNNDTGATTAAPGNGGGMHITGPSASNITGGTVSNNTAAQEGGGLWNGTGAMTIDGTTIDGNTGSGAGAANGGGGIFNLGGTLVVSNATISNNVADGASGSGGGILNTRGGDVTVTDSSITGNTSNRAGGGIEDNSTIDFGGETPAIGSVTLTDVTLDGNTTGNAPGNGGGMHLTGGAISSITGGTVSGNTAGKEGGGLWNGSGVMTISGTTIDGNDAQGNFVADPLEIIGGGGIFANDNGTVVIEAGTTISNNQASGTQGSGGGILVAQNANLDINGTVGSPVIISGNFASRAGGGIEDWSTTATPNTIDNTDFTGNSAGVAIGTFVVDGAPGNGGAIHVSGPGNNDITGGTASGNLAAAEGGGFWNGSGTMTVDGTTLDANIASGAEATNGGGALFNIGGTLTVSNATISNNIADGAAGSGGGILNVNGGTLSVSDSSITGNTSNRAGGGIEDNSTVDTGSGPLVGSVTLMNVALDNNMTGSAPGNGGGMHLTGGATSMITGGTVNGNTAAQEGGGLWNGTGAMTIDGTTIDGNTGSGADAANGGGGIFNLGGTLVVSNATISNNVADGASGSGGGILNTRGGDVTVTDSSITGNTSNRAGGGIEDNSTIDFGGETPAIGSVTLTDVTLDGNTTENAPGNGGGMHLTGGAISSITGGTVSGNTAGKEGGGLWNGSGVMTISGTTIDGNDAQGNFVADPLEIIGGGGIFANDNGTVVIEAGTTISNNQASGTQGSGGGILVAQNANLDINGTVGSPVVISGNFASRAGGGIEDWSTTATPNTIDNTDFTGNSAGVAIGTFVVDGAPGNGGAIHVSGPGNNDITGGTASGNLAAAEGGGFWNGSGTMTVDGTTLDANIASGAEATNGGGALFNIGGTLTVSNATISNNIADGAAGSGGGILNVNGGTLSVSDSSITGNSSNRAGGGIEDNSTVDTGSGPLVGSVTLMNVTLDNNMTGSAPGNGGGMHLTGGATSMITGGTVNGNTAAQEGGGLWNGTGAMTIDGTTIDGNTGSGADAANGGGGIFNLGGTLVVSNATISNNVADGASGSGGGILNTRGGDVTVTDSSITGNTSNRAGGGIEDNSTIDFGGETPAIGSVTLTNVTLDGNTTGNAPGNGGGLHLTGAATSSITGGTVSGNTAGNEGGGLWNGSGVMDVDTVTIDSNAANGPDGGGGIYNNANGTINLMRSTVSNNTSAGNGGGVTNEASTTINFAQSTISTNSAAVNGGGMYNNGTASSVGSTFGFNTAPTGNGIAADASVDLFSTIVASDIDGVLVDLSGTFTSSGFNLIQNDADGVFPATGTDVVNQSSKLAELGDNGGATLTHGFYTTSPAIDAGSDANSNATDQIGQAIFNGTRDMGAYEFIGTFGVDDLGNALSDSTIFPNPSANGLISLNIPSQVNGTISINVHDMTGKRVFNQNASAGLINLDLSRLAVGTYLVNISNGENVSTLKLIMSR